jgi:Mg-chelatase subunit ChlD
MQTGHAIRPCTLCRLVVALCIAAIAATGVQAQKRKQTDVSSERATLKVISLDAGRYPTVGGSVQVMAPDGTPLWDMTKDQVAVREGGEPCTVTRFEPASKNEPINIGLVVDNSGSMLQAMQFRNTYPYLEITQPLEDAKTALRAFIEDFDSNKDAMQIIGFRDVVDVSGSFMSDRTALQLGIDAMYADGGTALYDAIHHALKQMHPREGIRAIIALSDGDDNSSTVGATAVISLAKQIGVPVYVIGLGTVQDDVLRRIAKQTGGSYAYTKSSKGLTKIYDQLKKRILSIYALEFVALDESPDDSLRTWAIDMDLGRHGHVFAAQDLQLVLPDTVRQAIAARDQTRMLTYAGGGVVALGAGALLFVLLARRRRQQQAASAPDLASGDAPAGPPPL